MASDKVFLPNIPFSSQIPILFFSEEFVRGKVVSEPNEIFNADANGMAKGVIEHILLIGALKSPRVSTFQDF